MDRARTLFFAACALSLVVHLGILGQSAFWLAPPASETPFPLAARLGLDEPPTAPKPLARSKPAAAAPAPVMPEPEPAPPPPVVPALHPATLPEPPSPARPAPLPAIVQPLPVEPAPTTPVSPDRPAPRQLPAHVVLRYAVQTGEEGFGLGQAIYTWAAADGRYRLESVAEATGLISLFMSGRIVQGSEGRLTPEGLQPEQFAQMRGEKRQDSARFDWAGRRLYMNGVEAALPAQTQDILSFSFQLALSVREDDVGREWRMAVTNGRRLNEYAFLLLGRERLELAREAVDVLHVRGIRSGEGSLDVWLAPARYWLPLRIRTLDTRGKVITLTLEDIGG